MITAAAARAILQVPPEIDQLIAEGALFVINHSAGKDSQAMFNLVKAIVPRRQLLVLHAVLPEVEWEGVVEHIKATIDDVPLIFAQSVKTFFDMVDSRKMFPSPKNRQCTSDLKRGPCEREVRRYLAEHPEFEGKIVNCMGMRAGESVGRSKLTPFKHDEKNSKAGRAWYQWLPIHHLSTDQVFEVIAAAGQKPHWAYSKGMSRLSCCFCIMASDSDLKIAAEHNPALYQRYAKKEVELGFTMSMSRKPLTEITGIPVEV